MGDIVHGSVTQDDLDRRINQNGGTFLSLAEFCIDEVLRSSTIVEGKNIHGSLGVHG
jgi:hypothetical protein